MFYVLDTAKGIPASLTDAKTKGIAVIAYGQFINDLINFLIIRQYNRLKSKQAAPAAAPTTRDCPYCLSTIPLKATRCAHCVAELKAG